MPKIYDPESGKFIEEGEPLPALRPKPIQVEETIGFDPEETPLESLEGATEDFRKDREEEERLERARIAEAEAELKAEPFLISEEVSWEKEAEILFAEYEYLAKSIGKSERARQVYTRYKGLPSVDQIPFLEDELDKLREEELQAETKGEETRARSAAILARTETRAKAEEEEYRRKRQERRLEPFKVLGKLAAEGTGLAVRMGPALIPTRKKELAAYVPKMGWGKPLMGTEMYTGEKLGALRIGFARGISTPQMRPLQTTTQPMGMDLSGLRGAVSSIGVSKELVLPMGWSREMGLAWQEIKENGDVDTAEHVKEELEVAGIPKARTATAIRQLKRKGAIRGTREPGVMQEVLVITGTMKPSEKKPGVYGFKGTGRYKQRKVRGK